MRLPPATPSTSRRVQFASLLNWAMWGFITWLIVAQFLGIGWDSTSNYVRTVFGRSPVNPPTPLQGFNDEVYSDRTIVCMAEGKTYVPTQLSKVLGDPKLALNVTDQASSVHGFRVIKRETMTLNPQIYDVYARVCDRVAFTLTAIQDSCAAIGYNATRTSLRIVDGLSSDAVTREVPRAIPFLIVPFWDNAVSSYYVVPSRDGASCVFRLAGVYQSSTNNYGLFRGVPRSIRTRKTEEWLQKPGGQWRNGWYEDTNGEKWMSNMLTSKNGNALGMEVRFYDTLKNKQLDCTAPETASLCKPAVTIEKWGTQFTTRLETLEQDQVFISNGDRFGLVLFAALIRRTVSMVYTIETFISNVTIFSLLLRWFVCMVAMLRSFRLGVSCSQTTGIGCLSSARTFNILPIMLLPRLKMTLLAFFTAGCYFEGQQSALADAWFVVYPGIVELLFYYFSLLNLIAKITYRRMSDVLFGPTLLFLCAMHFFRLDIAQSKWFGVDGRVSTLLLSDQVDTVKLTDFVTSDVALRLNGNARVLFAVKMAVLAVNLLPLVFAETLKGRLSHATCEIEHALALRASNIGGLGRSKIYAAARQNQRLSASKGSSAVSTQERASSLAQIFQSRALVESLSVATTTNQVQPVNTLEPNHDQQHHILLSYELTRLGYLVFGGKFLLSYDDWYVLTALAPLRVLEKLWNYRVSVFEVTKSDDGCYCVTHERPRLCRVDDARLRGIPFYDVTVCTFK